VGLWKLLNAPQSNPFAANAKECHPPEGGAKGLEDRVKPQAGPGSVVPSFAKPAKLGQPLRCGAGKKH